VNDQLDCKSCKTLRLYDFSCPACVARYLKSLPAVQARGWWMRFKNERGPEFMGKVRELI